MPLEIERRFLVEDFGAFVGLPGLRMVQGYLSRDPERTVRLRWVIDPQGMECGRLTVKGPSRLVGSALVREEWEVELSADQVRAGLALCLPTVLEKTRLRVTHAGSCWDVDVFHGALKGLVLAEIELEHPQQDFVKPPWLGREISGDPCFSNSALSKSANDGASCLDGLLVRSHS